MRTRKFGKIPKYHFRKSSDFYEKGKMAMEKSGILDLV